MPRLHLLITRMLRNHLRNRVLPLLAHSYIAVYYLVAMPTSLLANQLAITIPEFTKERYLSRVAKARALVPLREKFAHFLFSSYLFFYFIFHLLCYISVSHKVCSFQWCQKVSMLYWEIKIGSQNGDSEWLCKSQPYLRVQNL